nr:hypothetical protein [Oedogonium sp. 260_circle1_72169]
MQLHFYRDRTYKYNHCTPPVLFRRLPPQTNYLFVIILKSSSVKSTQPYKRMVCHLCLYICFPSILLFYTHCAVTKYSQGAQGLFVPCQLFRIFTENSISQSLYRRQRDSRDAIHAGRQLCAKEFRSNSFFSEPRFREI